MGMNNLRMIAKVATVFLFSLMISVSVSFAQEGFYEKTPEAGIRSYKLYTHQDQNIKPWVFKVIVPNGWEFDGGLSWLLEPYQLYELKFSLMRIDGDAMIEVTSPGSCGGVKRRQSGEGLVILVCIWLRLNQGRVL